MYVRDCTQQYSIICIETSHEILEGIVQKERDTISDTSFDPYWLLWCLVAFR